MPERPAESCGVDRVEATKDKGDGDVDNEGDDDHGRLRHAIYSMVKDVRVWKCCFGQFGPCEANGTDEDGTVQKDGGDLHGSVQEDVYTNCC